MSTINERVKELRRSPEVGLTMEKFGEKLGVTKATISRIENGTNNVTEQMFTSICREFNVNPEWLRDGVGEMFLTISRNDQIASFIGDILRDEPEGFKARLISALSEMNEDGWKALADLSCRLVADSPKDGAHPEK